MGGIQRRVAIGGSHSEMSLRQLQPKIGGGRLVQPRLGQLRRFLQPELHQQVEVVALVEDLHVDLGVQLPQPADLAVLLGDQPLVERGDLDVQVVGRQVEVRPEGLGRLAGAVPLEGEFGGLVLPGNPVEVEQLGELPLGVVSEADGFAVDQGGYPPDPDEAEAGCAATGASARAGPLSS